MVDVRDDASVNDESADDVASATQDETTAESDVTQAVEGFEEADDEVAEEADYVDSLIEEDSEEDALAAALADLTDDEVGTETTVLETPVRMTSQDTMSMAALLLSGIDESDGVIAEQTFAPEPPAVPEADAPRQMDMGPQRRFRWWILIVVLLAVAAVAAVGGYGYWWFTMRPIVVPDIIGKKPVVATQVLNDLSLRLGKVSEIPTEAAPPGTIITQKPEAGETLKPGDEVSFSVAASPEYSNVPEVSGRQVDEAAKTLATARLRARVVESYSTSVAAGFVTQQLPAAGAEVEPGSAVALLVSKGPAPAFVTSPRVIGLLEVDATRLAEAAGLKAMVYRSVDPSTTVGEVIAQAPEPSLSVQSGSVIQLLVSADASGSTVAVPNVSGSKRATAIKKLTSKKLLSEVIPVAHASIKAGNVVGQMPPAGSKASKGSTVGLLVSQGPSLDTTVPSLAATNSVGASMAISAAGFTPFVIEIPIVGHTAGEVFMQYPLPGALYPPGFPVIALVAQTFKP